ncbi:MAG: hypothetical protein SXQ77_10775, partial [Halobacteria archaeon]|nr:hypothetical protein [Halobacteria archaeon]
MNRRLATVSIAIAVAVLVTVGLLLPMVAAQEQVQERGYEKNDFKNITGEHGPGFGDDMNNYPWGMEKFEGDLYVSTGRNVPGEVFKTRFEEEIFGWTKAADPQTNVTKYRKDMSAGIWRRDGKTGKWERVYKDPIDSKVYIGFRTLKEFNGKLYAGVGKNYYFSDSNGTPLLLSSEDGENWSRADTEGIPDVVSNTRALAVHNGKLYLGSFDEGRRTAAVYVTENPAEGWGKVFSYKGGNEAVSLETFNDRLYVGTVNIVNGYKIFRSNSSEPSLGNWTRVVRAGAGSNENWMAGTMETFEGHLYVGSM